MNNNRKVPVFPKTPGHHWGITTNDETTKKTYIDCEKVCTKSKLQEALMKFSKEMQSYYWANVQTIDEFHAKVLLRDMITRVLQTATESWPGWPCSAVSITGSSITGLGSRNSDVDLCVTIPGALQFYPNDREACRNCVKLMEFRLKENDSLRMLIEHPTSHYLRMRYIDASIPVLKIVATINDFDIECDLTASCNKEGFVSALHNSFLLRHYVRFDDRVGPLCFFIKRWAKNFGIYDPVNGRINSYCLTLLVIHYLQCGLDPPILPNLWANYPGFFAVSEQDFPKTLDFDAPLPQNVDAEKANPLELGQLFYGFLAYYTEFDFKKLRIDMQEACVKGKTQNRNRPRVLDIRDPIDRHNPGRTLQEEGLEFISTLLRETRLVFQEASVSGHLPPFEFLIGDAYLQ